jgi:hypothetical protein
MINNKTYQNVVSVLKAAGDLHKQINTTTVGDIYDVDLEKKNTKYPLMHINPTSVQANESSLTYNFQIFVMDLVSEDTDWSGATVINQSNEQEVLSDCLSISTDIIGMFRHSDWQTESGFDVPVYFSGVGQTLEPFTERFDQNVTGWVFTIAIETENDFQTCVIPVEPN